MSFERRFLGDEDRFLPPPQKVYPDGVLYNGDCLDVMEHLNEGSIGLIIADYPWNIGKKSYDKIREDYFEWFDEIVAECTRLLMPRRSLLSEISIDWIYESLEVLNKHLYYKQPIISYCNNCIGRRTYVGWSHYQFILWHGKPQGKKPPVVLKRYRDVLEWSMKSTKHEGWTYPNPKSIEVYRTFIRMFSKEGDTVLDPFMGSGTTALACRAENRNFIGIEINPEYWQLEQERLNGKYQSSNTKAKKSESE